MDTMFILFLLPFFFLLHELEEILMVHRWIEKNGAAMHRRFPRLRYLIRKMEEMTTRRFATIAFEEFLIVSACTFVSQQAGDLRAWYCYLAAFSIHLFVHIIQFIVWRRYIPAIISTVLCLPYCIWAIHDTYLFFSPYELFFYTILGTLLGGVNLIGMHAIMYRLAK